MRDDLTLNRAKLYAHAVPQCPPLPAPLLVAAAQE